MWVRWPADSTERVFGGGEQFTHLNLRGHRFPIWTREGGIGRDDSFIADAANITSPGSAGDYHTTYWPQASFLSTRKYYFVSDFLG